MLFSHGCWVAWFIISNGSKLPCSATSYCYITLLSLSPVVVTFIEAEGNPCWLFFLVSSFSPSSTFVVTTWAPEYSLSNEQWLDFCLCETPWQDRVSIIMVLPCFVSGTSGSSCVTAALGNTWSHSVNTRLILQYLGSERRQVSALTMFSDSQGQGTRYTSNLSVHLLKALATLSVLGQHCQRVGKETSLPAYLNSSSNKVGRQVTHREKNTKTES